MTTLAISGEEWRDVPSIPGAQASSLGRVRLLPMVRVQHNGARVVTNPQPTFGRIAKKNKTRGYLRLTFLIKRGPRHRLVGVARLVCEAFHGPPPPDKPLALHIDENSLNNTPGNLKWGSQKENLNSPVYLATRHVWRQPKIVLADGFSF
jgi:hypothetical protein